MPANEFTIGPFVGAILGLITFTFLFKDNIAYRVAMHIMIGVGQAFYLCAAITSIYNVGLLNISKGYYVLIVPMLLGVILVYGNLFKKYRWASRWPLVIVIGIGYGIAVRGAISTDLIGQIVATILPITTTNITQNINNIIIIIGTICSFVYFIFTYERKGPLKYISQIGRTFLLLCFGASFGGVLMQRSGGLFGIVVAIYNGIRDFLLA